MTLPAIAELKQNEDEVLVSLMLPADLDVFRGHFPDTPVLPGVAQLDWAMRLAARCFGLADPVAQDFQVKFSGMIRPGVALLLALKIDSAKQRLSFEYRVDQRIMSSGRINLQSVS